jgi:Cu(I)/Ag(I) efflux system membrane fusion protein/cobalt-zinc-cadmium efflux system membrane fusion protein
MRGTSLFVTLTDAAGNPIPDASVRVVFFMPAMPAMGMAAIRAEASLNPNGGGIYRGQITLPSTGTWQVTITAERGGTLLGTQQLSVAAQP